MDDSIPTEYLVGVAEIAKRLGLSRTQLIHNWRARDIGFPEPVAELTQGLLFDWREVESWAQRTGRLKRK